MNIVSTAAQASALSSGNVFVRSAAVFVMSMLPFIENKGAIILAAALKLKWYLTYLLTCIGSYLPVPLLLRMKKHPLGQKETSPRLLRNAHQALEKHEAQLKKYGPPALFVCVCIPFTGVGCWIGSMLARLTDMDERRDGGCFSGIYRKFVYFLQNCPGFPLDSVKFSMCFPIDAVGKLVYDNTIEFERILFWKEANTMTFRYTIAKNNMMMRMLFSRACNMARCFGMRCCSPENNA